MADTYFDEIEKWRSDRAKNLAAPDGWLSTAGLFWLEPGENRMGADPSAFVRLPVGSGSEFAGSFFLSGGEIRLEAAEGVKLLLGDSLVQNTLIHLEDDLSEPIYVNDLKIFVIQRGERFGVRVFDPRNPVLLSFTGLDWFPIDPAYRVQARFLPFVSPRSIQIINVLGDMVQMACPGMVEFSLHDQQFQLEPVEIEEGRLWILFRDATNGNTTYPAGRYLTAGAPDGDRVVIDFNRAYNPPCAFTEFATCPLPPPSNRLEVEIRAGERRVPE